MKKVYLLFLILSMVGLSTAQNLSSNADLIGSAIEGAQMKVPQTVQPLTPEELAALPMPNILPGSQTNGTRALYLAQDFEGDFTGSPAAPAGWTQSRIVLNGIGTPSANGVDGEKDWQQNTWSGSAWGFPGYGSVRPTGAVSGTKVLFMEDGYFGSTSTWFGSRRVETPAVNLTASTSPYVRFYYFYPAASSTIPVRVMASNDNGATWNSIMVVAPNAGATTMTATTPWQRINVSIPLAYRVANAKFGIEMSNTWGTSDIYIDDFTIEDFIPTTITSAATGNWSAPATWVGGVLPTADNHVVIAAGHTVSADVNIARCQNLTVNGTFQYSGVSTSQLVQVFGNIQVNAGGSLKSFSGTTGKRFYLGGSLTNDGTVDFSIGAGNLVWLGGAPATLGGSGTFTGGFISNSWHMNSGGVTYNVPIQIRNTIGLYCGSVNPNGNLTAGGGTVTTQTIERSYLGSFTQAPIWFAAVNRTVNYVTANIHTPGKSLFTTGHEIRQTGGVGYIEGTLLLSTFDNVQLGVPTTLGTATLGTLTMTRGILVTTDVNLLTLSSFATGSTGTAPTIATSPLTHITNHGSYISGPIRINFPSTGTASRNFPLGYGTEFSGPARNGNILKTITFASTAAWTGSTVKVNLTGAPSGTANSPINNVIGTRGWFVDLLGGPEMPSVTTVTIRGINNTGGNSDQLLGDQSELRIAQSPALTGPWTNRSNTSGTGALVDNTYYTRTSPSAAPGPIVPFSTNGGYFAFATTMTAAGPSGVSATAVSPTQINVAFTPNAGNNNVVIIYNLTGTFTDPTGAPPAVGQAFAGGTVLYNGLTSPVNHTGLNPATTYYYKAFSYTGSVYSTGVAVNATTQCQPVSSFPWTESFEGVTIPALPSCWYKENGDWATTNNANSTNDADARTGTQFLREQWFATNEYIWSPGFQLTAGTSYDFSFWWAGDTYSGWTGDVFYNTAATSAGATQMGASFVENATTTSTTYTKVARTLVPVSSGVYYFAVRVNCPTSTPWYLSFDDFTFGLTPPPCTAPAAQPTALLLTPTTTTVAGSFTASATASGYVVVQSSSATLGGAPVNMTTYAPGASIGSGTVVSSGTGTTFTASSLTGNTQYYYFVFAYAQGDNCLGPVYRTSSPLSGNTTTLPAAPASFTASPVSASQISFTATPNAAGNNIIVAWNTSNTFGSPTGSLVAGQTITGGGTVHYVGSAAGLYAHTGLNSGTAYYYRVWSVISGPTYSTTFLNASATTPFSPPFVEYFDTTPAGSTPPTGWTSHASAALRPWTIATNLGSVSPSNVEAVYYSSTAAKNEYLVTPPIQMTAGQPYLIKFWVNAPGYAGIPEKLKLLVANAPTLPAISAGTILWDRNNLMLATYTEFIVNYTPATSGIYYFGWHAYSVADVDYIAVDNVSIIEQPAFEILPEAYNFREVNVGFQSAPKTFTFRNNRNTSITVASVNFTGTNANQFVKNDNNTYPKVLGPGAEMTVDVVFKPTSTGNKAASLQVIDNNGTYTAALSGTGYVNGPQLLAGTAVAPSSVQLNWEAPLPSYEIRSDDNSAESWYWVASPSTTSQYFYTKMVIPANGVLNKIGILTRANSATTFESVRLCPDLNGKPNLASPVQSFANQAVTSVTGQWLLLTLSSPLNVTAGQVYYIVTQWPAASTVGPFVGTDVSGAGYGMCGASSDAGATWSAFPYNLIMRGYMTTAAKSADSPDFTGGEMPGEMAILPVEATTTRVSELINPVAPGIEVPGFKVEQTNAKAPADYTYTVKRGTTTGVYETIASNIQTNSYLDATSAAATTYYYQVDAVYPAGAGSSNEATVTTLCTTLEIPYTQNFSAATIPPCWSQTFSGALTSNRWAISTTNTAGGTANEMKATYQSGVGISRLISPAFNTTGASALLLSFKHYYDAYGSGITYKIQTSSDGVNWTNEAWVFDGTATNAGPESVFVNLQNNIGNTTYIAWVLDGDHYQFDYWYIDDVQVTSSMSVTPIPHDLSCFNSHDGAIELVIEGGVPPYTFVWQGPDGFTSSQQNISNLAAGTYIYSVIDANNVNASNIVTLTQPAAIPIPTVQNLTVTYDGMLHTINGVAPAGTSLVWYDAASGGEVIEAPSETNAGVYNAWVAAFDAVAGCESARVAVVLTINKKGLTVTADNKTKCQFTPNPELTFAYAGFVAGEGTENLETAPTATTTALPNSAPGTYPITLGGGVSSNYSFTYVNATLTVIKSPIINAGPDGSVCSGESFQFVAASASNYTTILWTTSGNGTFSSTSAVNPVYTPGSLDIANGSATLTLTGDPGSSCSQQSSMVLTIQNDLQVSVEVIQVTEDVCVGTLVHFMALPTNGGLTPAYQWKVNGTNAGTNSSDFAYVPANNDVVTVVLTSSIGCALNNPATSAPLTVHVTSDLTAGVSIFANATSVCDFTSVTFTAVPENGGSNPSYQWFVNNVVSGANASTFSFIPLDGDEVHVVMTSNHACAVVPVATSNTVEMNVAPPFLELFANPVNGGTVNGSGNYPAGTEVTVVATPSSGWEFLNWKNADGTVISTNASYVHTINYCYEALTATFSSTAKIAGQLKYFNNQETIIPSPNNYGVFYVQLFEGETAIGERQLLRYNIENGLDSYYEYIGVESGKDYKLRIWEQATNNQLGNVWTWNNWGGTTANDALIIGFMTANNPILTQLPWIAPVAVPNYTPLFSKVADMNNSNSLTGVDALLLQYVMTGAPGYMPLPGGAHNFRLATTRLPNHGAMAYPNAPELLFTPFGNYQATTTASDVYHEVSLNNLSDGLNVFNIYLVSSGDVNASYKPGINSKMGADINYDGLLAAKEGEVVIIPVKVNQSIDFAAMSIGFNFDNNHIEVLSVENYPIHYIDNEASTVKVAWVDQQGKSLSNGDDLMLIKARIVGNLQSGDRYFELMPDVEFADINASVIGGVGLTIPYIESGVTGLNDSQQSLAHSAYPNPFRGQTRINYLLPEAGKVKISLYNNFGQEIKILVDENLEAGSHQLLVNSSDLKDAGQYFYRISLDGLSKFWTVKGTLIYVE